jgi:Uma2 family endonuclease
MLPMTRTTDFLEAIAHLPAGATLVLPDVDWESYEGLLDSLSDRPGLRVSYDTGRLEIVSPLPRHEIYKEILACLVRGFAEETDTPLESLGSTTWKRRKLLKGAEPDGCFYVANASRITGKEDLDLNVDPPPDIAIEIDTTRSSLSKFPIYAALGVPEMWRCDGKTVEIHRLKDGAYVKTEASAFLVGLTGAILTEFLGVGKAQGQTATLKLFRQRIRSGL